MRISDWSSDVCSSDLADQSADDRAAQEVDLAAPGRREGLRQAKAARGGGDLQVAVRRRHHVDEDGHAIETDERGDHLDATQQRPRAEGEAHVGRNLGDRSEEHTSELQSLMRISYAVFCLKKKNK